MQLLELGAVARSAAERGYEDRGWLKEAHRDCPIRYYPPQLHRRPELPMLPAGGISSIAALIRHGRPAPRVVGEDYFPLPLPYQDHSGSRFGG